MAKYVCLITGAVLLAAVAIAKEYYGFRGQKASWLVWVPAVSVFVVTLITASFDCRSQRRSAELAAKRHSEVINVANASGTLLHPTRNSPEEMMQLVLGDNVFRCPRGKSVDLGKVLSVGGGPSLNVVSRDNRLFVSTTIQDERGQVIAIVEDNRFAVLPRSTFTISALPNQVTVKDQAGLVVLDVVLESPLRARLWGIFYTDRYKCVIDNNGVVCDAISEKATIKHLVVQGNNLTILPTASTTSNTSR